MAIAALLLAPLAGPLPRPPPPLAVLQWLFAPATHAGRPVATLAEATVRFAIY